ncbi:MULTISPECIES: beta-mannanase [unclassified Paenibacillus]|uniref:beta-mannanase n=1 Tax=unclassified Paenibacillus TaxID=185978 RepID=UPI0036D2AA60
MHVIDAEDHSPLITGLTKTLEEERCTLRWLWPAGVEAVYISKSTTDVTTPAEDDFHDLKLYTKGEYKASNGYVTRLDNARFYRFTVYMLKETEQGAVLVRQPNQENRIEISAGRAKVYYSITEKSGLFSKQKKVHIEVHTEVALAHDVLCYVKKNGGFPANRDDGLRYSFVTPFVPGRNVLPPVEIGKADHVRLFLSDAKMHGQLYELIYRPS